MEYIFITVNYNGSLNTEKFINSIFKLKKNFNDLIKIIIVDNNSSEKEQIKLEEIKNIYKIRIIKSDTNKGYFGGLNLGLEAITDKENKRIIICNNDLIFNENFLIELSKLKYEKNIFLLSPDIVTLDGKRQNPHVLKKVSKYEIFKSDIYFINYNLMIFIKKLKKIIFKKKIKSEKKERIEKVQVIKRGIGACYVLTENFFEKYEKLNDEVFLWGEEAILTNQIEKYEGKTLYVPMLKVLHLESQSVKNIPSKEKYKILKKSYKVYRKYL